MKSYLLKTSETKKLGDKTEQHYLAEYSEEETKALQSELNAFLKSQKEPIVSGSVRENLHIVAAENEEDLAGLFQTIREIHP